MSNQHGSFGARLLSMVMVSVLGVGGWTVYNRTLETQRPQLEVHRLNTPSAEVLERVPARLWQDPFQAVTAAKEREKKSSNPSKPRDTETTPSPDSTTEHPDESSLKAIVDWRHLAANLMPKSEQSVLRIILAPLPAGDYPEDTEQRLRIRYAVITSMVESGFLPQNSDHLGVIDLGKLLTSTQSFTVPEAEFSARASETQTQSGHASTEVQSKAASKPLMSRPLAPFEILERTEHGGAVDSILILWLDEDRLMSRGPFGTLMARLKDTFPSSGDAPRNVTYTLLGPTNSQKLIDFAGYFAPVVQENRSGAAGRTNSGHLSNSTDSPTPDTVAKLWVDEIVSGADSYLDEGLTDTSKDELKARLAEAARAAAEDRLDQLETIELLATELQDWGARQENAIEDADKYWYMTVANIFRMNNITADNGAAYRAGQLLGFMHQYLDGFGWRGDLVCPEDKAGAPGACVTDIPLYDAFKSALSRQTWNEVSADLNGVLKKYAGNVEDSDPSWQDTVVGYARFAWHSEGVPDTTQEQNDHVGQQNASDGRQAVPSRNLLAAVASGLSVYSYRATVPDDLILKSIGAAGQHADLAEYFADLEGPEGSNTDLQLAPIRFTRCVFDDREMAYRLKGELLLRGINVSSTDTHFAIVTEMDTPYGRRMRTIFREAFRSRDCCHPRQHDGDKGPYACTPIPEGCDKGFHIFHYLRGLDGTLASGATLGKARESQDSSASLSDPRATYRWVLGSGGAREVPLGVDQRDYVRRLVSELLARDTELRRETGAGLRAIGVLGSDAFDKEIILQALKLQFPQTAFFTTDLDARLAHPSQYHWSRNLLVASSYGLHLDRKFQATTPPFRDSYQTAAFLATRLALTPMQARSAATQESRAEGEPLGSEEASGPHDSTPDIWRALDGNTAQLFEISRYGAWDLCDEKTRSALHPESTLGHGRTAVISWWKFALAVVVTLIALPVFFSTFQRPLHRAAGDKASDVWGPWMVVVLVGMVLSMLLWGASRPDPMGEPFAWFAGVSVWPSVIIRFLAALLALFLLWHASALAGRRRDALARRYGCPLEEEWQADGYAALRRVLLLKPSAPAPADDANAQTCNKPPDPVWCHVVGAYSDALSRNPATARVALGLFLLFMSLHLFDVWHLRRNIWIRGEYMYWLERGSYFCGLFALLVLTCYVLQLCVAGQAFIRWLLHEHADSSADLSDSAACAVEIERIELAGTTSRSASEVLTYPLYALGLMLFARLSLFDGWGWSYREIGAIGILVGCTTLGGLLLRQTAEKLRGDVLERLESREVTALKATDSVASELIQRTMKRIAEYDNGAFGSVRQQPVVRALVVPLGGLILIVLLDMLYSLGV